MAIYVKKVMTENGPVSIDYQSLANLPTIDETIIDGSKNAVQGNAVYEAVNNINTQLSKKLDATNGKAADSEKFGGQSPEYYVSQADLQKFAEDMGLEVDANTGAIESLSELLNTKLDATAQAVDSAKLNGQAASYYATKTAVDAAQLTADNAWTEAQKAMMHLCGCWIEFTDEDGNPTDEPYVHWNVDEETGTIVTGLAYSDAEESEY